MDTKVVEVNKNIFVYSTLETGASGQFSFEIYVEFIPDVVIVKDISYCFNQYKGVENEGPESGVGIISSNLVDNKIVGSFIDGKSMVNNSSFILRKPVSGTYSFSWQSIDPDVDRSGDIVIHLDFVKYREGKDYKEGKEGKIRYKVNVE